MSTEFVNKHITRVLAAGGTVPEIAWLDTVDAWITANVGYGYLLDWSNVAFGVIKNGSNQISKIMGLGTTWLPRLGDLTPTAPASTLYDATAIGSKPAWTNTAYSAYSYYGAARAGHIRTQQIRRKHHQGITLVSVYKKNHTDTASMIGHGQGSFPAIVLQNTVGSPGFCKVQVGPDAFAVTNATTLANNAVHIIGGTFDGDKLVSYVEGVAGAQNTGYVAAYADSSKSEYRPLLGAANLVGQHYYMLASGTSNAIFNQGSGNVDPVVAGNLNEAAMSISDLIMFYTALTPTQMASLNTLLRTRYGP